MDYSSQQQQEQQQQQQQTEPEPEPSDLDGLEDAIHSMAIGPVPKSPEVGTSLIFKGPKRSEQQVKKSDQRLHQPVSAATASGGGGGGTQLPASMQLSYLTQQQQLQQQQPQQQYQQQPQQQYSCLISPVTSPSSQQAWTPILSQSAQGQLDFVEGVDILQEIIDSPSYQDGRGLGLGGVAGAASHSELGFYTSSVSTPQPPPPPPPPPPIAQAPLVTSAVPVGASGASAVRHSGPPVSDATRRALIQKLNPAGPQTPMVDENFNTPLHQAVLLQQTSEHMDYLLSDLKRQKRLQPIINLVNINGHTPLSLCLKMARADLIPLLLNFDAVPTQLCGSASERTNHFHYAMAKCLDNTQSLQLVATLIHSVCQYCQMDMVGLQAKNRCGKTAIDFLRHRISQLSCQQDPANAELLRLLQSLQNRLVRQLGNTA